MHLIRFNLVQNLHFHSFSLVYVWLSMTIEKNSRKAKKKLTTRKIRLKIFYIFVKDNRMKWNWFGFYCHGKKIQHTKTTRENVDVKKKRSIYTVRRQAHVVRSKWFCGAFAHSINLCWNIITLYLRRCIWNKKNVLHGELFLARA